MMDFFDNFFAWLLSSEQHPAYFIGFILACFFSIILMMFVISNDRTGIPKNVQYIVSTCLVVMFIGSVSIMPFFLFYQDGKPSSRYAHQETIKPYQYILGKDDQFYYKMSKNDQTHQGHYDDTKVKLSDHAKTVIYGKKWVANKNATKYERRFVKQQDIEWHKVEYREAAD